jgi:hypothetical protein
MTYASTATNTFTFARIELLKMQIRRALRRATAISEDSLQRIEKGIDLSLIARVSVYGYDAQGLATSELRLEIDWSEYNTQISKGRVSVTIDDRWQDHTAIDVDEAVRLFVKYVDANKLSTNWLVYYGTTVNVDEANQRLGFRTTSSPTWAARSVSSFSTVPELPELRVGVTMIDR